MNTATNYRAYFGWLGHKPIERGLENFFFAARSRCKRHNITARLKASQSGALQSRQYNITSAARVPK